MSVNQIASYVNAPLVQPAVSSGHDLLAPNQVMIRPKIGGKRRTIKKRKAKKSRKQRGRKQQRQQKQGGGFLPSIGEPFVAAVSKYIAPIALYGIYKFINGAKTRKARK
jgi:hypothetical protein